MDSNNYNTNQEHKDSDKDNTLLHLSLSEKTRQKGMLQDIVINKKTNNIIATLNHGCKKTIISSIYPDWIKTTSVFKKQAEGKGLSSEDTSHILDELDDNYETILKCILEDGVFTNNSGGEKEDLEHTTQRKDAYIKKYSRNGVPLSECIVIVGHSKFLQLVDGKSKLINKIEIGNKTFYPNDTVDSQNPLPYVFESINELDTYLQNARNESLDTLYLKVKSIYKKYVDAEEKYIVLLAADTILSYFQDKFGTMHYNILVGDNGSGKNSALLVYRYLGYRVFYVTAASAANYYTFLGETEEGQGTLAEDEADNIHLQQDKYKICKTGYASGGSVPKVDIHSGGNGRRSQGVYLTYCMKWFAMEELPDYKKAKGFLDRSFVYKFVVGRVKYNIKDVINYAGDPKFKPLHDELLEVRKLLFAHRILHFNDVIYGVNLNIRNRNEELTKPLIRLFRNSPAALAEILPVLSEFLNERNEVKKNSFESKLFDVVKNLIKGGEERTSTTTRRCC